MADEKKVTIDPQFVQIVAGCQGATVATSTLIAAAQGKTRWFQGCITRLYYGDDGKDLDFIAIDGPSPGQANPSNLKDFRERLEEAACCGHEVSFTVRENNTMFMLNVRPCKCKCDKQDH